MSSVTRTILEGVILLVIAVGVGFGMNAIRERDRIDVSRNYKPAIDPDAIRAARERQQGRTPGATDGTRTPDANAAGSGSGSGDGGSPSTRSENPDDGIDTPPAHVSGAPQITPAEPTDAIPFKRVDIADVKALRDAPDFEYGAILILDARSDDLYAAGHIPGAIQFDFYRYEQFIDHVIPLAMAAQHIVIYCHGGDCEDSLLTAQKLVELAVPWDAIFVYEGGWEDWESRGAPVATGQEG